MEYLILRRRIGIQEFGAENFQEASAQELSDEDAMDLQRDESIDTLAPSMPLKLIEPKAIDSDLSLEGNETWGIRTIGASTSNFSGRRVNVAVIDTGIDKSHPAFDDIEIIGRNFTTDGGEEDVSDFN